MGKFAKEVLTVAAIAVTVFASGGTAIPAWIAGATSTYAAAAWATVAFYSAVIVGGSALAQNLAPKPTRQQMENRVQIRSSMASRKIIYGRAASGGLLVWAHSHGTDNEWLTMVHAHSVGECEGLVKMVVGGSDVTIDGSGDAVGNYSGYIKCFFHAGTDTQAADSNIVGLGSWTSAHQLKGICYTVSQFKFDRKKFPNGLPAFYFVIDGRKIYDPRLDSTQTEISGSGSHLENDPTTWEFSANPALVYRDYKRDDTYGCAIPSARIDIVEVAAAANVCEETVTHKSGSGDRYSLGGVIDTGSRKADNVSMIVTSMGGFEVYTGGKFIIKAGSWDTPSITLDESDLRAPARLTTKVSRQERYNAVRGQYLDGDTFAVTDFPPLQNTTYETYDGEQLWLDLSLALVKDHRDAQRLAKISLERARREEVLTWPGKLLGYQLRAGDTVSINYDRFSYTAKTFRVIEWKLAPDGGVDMVLKAEDSTVYDWTAATDEADPKSGGSVSVRDPATTIDPAGLILAATTTTGTGGEVIPAISVTWTADSSPFIDRMLIEYKKTTATVYQRLEGADAADGSALIPNLASGTNYTVRLTYITTSGVASDTPATGAQTTGSAYTAGDAGSVDWGNVQDDGGKPDDYANRSGSDGVLTDPLFLGTYNGGSEIWVNPFWGRNNSTYVTIDPTGGANSQPALKLEGGLGSGVWGIDNGRVYAQAGDKIIVRAHVKATTNFNAAGEFFFTLNERDKDANYVRNTTAIDGAVHADYTAGSWVTLEGSVTVIDSTTQFFFLQIVVASSMSSGDILLVDKVQAWVIPKNADNEAQEWDDVQDANTTRPEDNATNNQGALADLDSVGDDEIDDVSVDKLTIGSLSVQFTITTGGSIVLSAAGNIRGGQTAYDTGSGFFLGYSGGAYKFSIGDGSSNWLRWTGTALEASGDIYAKAMTNDEAVADQWMIDSTTEVSAAAGGSTAYDQVRELGVTRYGACRIKVEVKNGYAGSFTIAPSVKITQNNGAVTLTGGSAIDITGDTSYTWYTFDVSGVDPTLGPIEISLRSGYDGSTSRISWLRGTEWYMDFPMTEMIRDV